MRVAPVGLVVGILGIQVVMLGTARADCAMPNPVTAPHDGATVPPDPTVYVFVPSYQADNGRPAFRARSEGKTLAFDTTVVSKTDAFWTFRLDVATDGGSSIEVYYDDVNKARYTVDPNWARPAEPFAKLHDTEYVLDRWTCSFTDAHFLTVSDAPAYRVELGDGTSFVAPHHVDDLWLWGDREPQTGHGRIGIGHMSCMGATADYGPEHATRRVRVTPLYPDGSSGWEWEQRIAVDRDGIATRLAPPPAPAPTAATASRRLAPARRAFDKLPLLGLVAFAFGFALARLRVRRATAATRAHLATLSRWSVPQVLCAVTAAGAIWLALYAGTATDAGAAFGFSIATATWAGISGAAAALSR